MLEMMNVDEMMDRTPITISERTSIATARALMEQCGLRHLAIVNDRHLLLGVVSDRDLLAAEMPVDARISAEERTDLQLGIPVHRIMTRRVHSARASASVVEVAQQMLEKRHGCTPIVDGDGYLMGMVTQRDMMLLALGLVEDRILRVRDLMAPDAVRANSELSLSAARSLMERMSIRHLPVVDEEDQLLGILSDRDLLAHQPSRLLTAVPVPEDLSVFDAMTRDPWTTTPDACLYNATETLIDHLFSCLPVVEEGRLVGVLTETDFLRYLAGRPGKDDRFEATAVTLRHMVI